MSQLEFIEDLEQIARANVGKLMARYPAGFTEHDAIHRDVHAEVVAMGV